MSAVADRFGTARGLVRLALAHVQVRTLPCADLKSVERLVFVCRGNICRSAFAEHYAAARGLKAASFGIRTSAGRPAHPPVAAAAPAHGIDLSAHASVPAEEFAIQPGDLLLAMEFRQLAHLRALPGAEHAQFDLLGRYGGKPHLHDPYGLSAEFTATSLSDIARSVDALAAAIERARTSR